MYVLFRLCYYTAKKGYMTFYNNLLAKCFLGKKALFYDRRVILYSVQVFGSLGRNGVKNTCTAILGVFLLTLIPALGLSLWFSWWWMVLPFMTYHLLLLV